MDGSGIRYLYIPGNSDVRDDASADEIGSMASETVTVLGDIRIFAVNDAWGIIDDETFALLEGAKAKDVMFMHHPIGSHEEETDRRLREFKESHPDVRIFSGHAHRPYVRENEVSLQALDPDKAIGECPSLTYYDTESGNFEYSHYDCPMPMDIFDYIGISAYRPEEHIEFATKRGIRYLELRPGVASMDEGTLSGLISAWRDAGGEHLSIHLPDIRYSDGAVAVGKSLDRLIYLADLLGADRVTQHVPRVSVKTVKEDEKCLPLIAKELAGRLNKIERVISVGVENMHMTAGESSDDTRRFGYTPPECIEFMREIEKHTHHKVGINLDVGHARNNSPFSQTYQVGAWYSEVGEYTVGYHIHQVRWGMEKFSNHTAITDVYGSLISYASFFKMWDEGKLNKAPFVFEMDGMDAYSETLSTFEREKERLYSNKK
jgi:sugar phosphate isomerase/epimerase